MTLLNLPICAVCVGVVFDSDLNAISNRDPIDSGSNCAVTGVKGFVYPGFNIEY